MKFREFANGLKNRKLFVLPLLRPVEAPAPTVAEGGGSAPPAPPPVREVTVALVPFFGTDETHVLKMARQYAIQNGVENPKPGEPIYERGLWLYTVLRSVMDADVTGRDEPFFESPDEILKFLDPGRISLLFHAQRAWQAKCAPTPAKMEPGAYIQHILQLAHAAEEEDRTGEMYEVPFDLLPVDMQLRFTRQLAKLFSDWTSIKSLSGLAILDAPTSSRSTDSPSSPSKRETSTSTANPSGGEAPAPSDTTPGKA